jgi:hypothetical protein
MWFTATDVIARMTTGGALQTFFVGSGLGLNDITAGPDGNLWFTEANPGRIGRITTPPNAATGGVGGIRPNRATVAGTVNGHSQPTDVAIEYGRVGGATTTTPANHLSTSAQDQSVSIALSGLAASAAYRSRVVATNQTGTTAGAFATFTTGPAPSCRVTRTKTGRGGIIKLALACAATERITARATTKVPRKKTVRHRKAARRRRTRTLLFGTARAPVVRGRATLRIKPRKAARAQLRRRRRLSVKIRMTLRSGDSTTLLSKSVRVRQGKRAHRRRHR